MAQMFPKNAKITIKLSDFESEPKGETEVEVSLNMWISMEAPGTEPSETTYGERVRLAKENDGWLIVPADPAKATTPLTSLASMLATDLSQMQMGVDRSQEQTQGISPSTVSIVNLKQIALGLIMYATDWNDVYPKKTWKKDVMPYLKNASILQPPKQENSPATEYLMNAALMGKSMQKLKFPALTVLAYEARGGQVTYNHSGKAAVAFADGHVKLITPEEMKKVRWTP